MQSTQHPCNKHVQSSFHLGAQSIYIVVDSIDTVLDLELKHHTLRNKIKNIATKAVCTACNWTKYSQKKYTCRAHPSGDQLRAVFELIIS